jgi:hypothetical protein
MLLSPQSRTPRPGRSHRVLPRPHAGIGRDAPPASLSRSSPTTATASASRFEAALRPSFAPNPKTFRRHLCPRHGRLRLRGRSSTPRPRWGGPFLAIVRDLDAAIPGRSVRLVDDWSGAHRSLRGRTAARRFTDMVRVSIHTAPGPEFPSIFPASCTVAPGATPCHLPARQGASVHWRNPSPERRQRPRLRRRPVAPFGAETDEENRSFTSP